MRSGVKVVVCFVLLMVVGVSADEEKDGVVKGIVGLSKDEEIGRRCQDRFKFVYSSHNRRISNGEEEFDRKGKGCQEHLQKGKPIKIPKRGERFGKNHLKTGGLNEFKENLEQSKNTLGIVDLKRKQYMKENNKGIRMRRAADKDVFKIEKFPTSKEDFNKIQIKKERLECFKNKRNCARKRSQIAVNFNKEDIDRIQLKRKKVFDKILRLKGGQKNNPSIIENTTQKAIIFKKENMKGVLMKGAQKNNPSIVENTTQKAVIFKKENLKRIRMKRSIEDFPKERVKSIVITKEVKVPHPVLVTKLVPHPVRVEVEVPVPVRVVKPVPVRVERVVRYPVRKRVPAPYPVVKEVPVFVRRPVVRPVPIRVARPFPVLVERRVPVPVVRRVLHPVRVPVRIPVPVLQPLVNYVLYPVQKKVLYPVKVPVSQPVPYPVYRPYPVTVEKTVPYPVVKHVPYPVPVDHYYSSTSTTTNHEHENMEGQGYTNR